MTNEYLWNSELIIEKRVYDDKDKTMDDYQGCAKYYCNSITPILDSWSIAQVAEGRPIIVLQ